MNRVELKSWMDLLKLQLHYNTWIFYVLFCDLYPIRNTLISQSMDYKELKF